MAIDTSIPHRVDQQETEILSDGHFRLEQITLRSQTFAGEMSRPVQREVLRSGKSVAVLLFDPATNHFIMTEQFRIGAFLNGETPEFSARREVEEETGCKVGHLEQIGAYLTSPGITDELATVFIGSAEIAHAGGVHGKTSEAEDIRTRVLTSEEALAEMDSGVV
ncbi:MAG: NUDIX domain-containing protein [Janthinobacterium lividum]